MYECNVRPDFSDELINLLDVPFHQMDFFHCSLTLIATGLPSLSLLFGACRFQESHRLGNVGNACAALEEAFGLKTLLSWSGTSTYRKTTSSIVLMRGVRPLVFACLLSAMVGFQSSATTITVNYDELSSPVQAAETMTFDASVNLPAGFTVSGVAQVGDTSVMDWFLAPTGDHTNYAWVGANSSLTYVFESPVSYLGFYWGSPDAYNKVNLTDVSGSSISFSPGQGALTDLKADQSTAAYVSFLDTGTAWVSVEFDSLGPAFEFDSLASETSPTPEPASICLIAVGLVIVGTFRRGKSTNGASL